MKLVALTLIVLIAGTAAAQTSPIVRNFGSEPLAFAEAIESGQPITKAERVDQLSVLPTKPEFSDSLIARRVFLTTVFYRNGKRLPNTAVIRNFLSNQKSVNQFQWGHVLNPIGPLISLSGVALSYVAIKGTPQQANITGIRTLNNPNVPDVPVEYTKRSLPKLLAGIGLFIGGICLIEISNDLMNKPANAYNAQLKKSQRTAFIHKVRLGITPDGNLGLHARF